jgi:hypothetical protein
MRAHPVRSELDDGQYMERHLRMLQLRNSGDNVDIRTSPSVVNPEAIVYVRWPVQANADINVVISECVAHAASTKVPLV